MLDNNQIEVELLSSWGSDRAVAEAAWVSTSTSKRSDEDVSRLINQMAEQGHGVPFEAISFRWWIRCPRYIETQIAKHRISSMNAASGRYRKVREGYMEPDEGMQELMHSIITDETNAHDLYDAYCKDSYTVYNKCMLAAKDRWGIQSPKYKRFKEFYRGMLPQSQMTELHLSMNLRSFANFYRQRSAKDAQLEIQEVSRKMYSSILKICPISSLALSNIGWNV